MHSAGTNKRMDGGISIFGVGATFSSTELAAAAKRGAMTLTAFSVLLFFAARPAQTQTETVLYNLSASGGGGPESGLTSDGKGNLYGTATFGGAVGPGTVFELSPNGSGGWDETVLYSFCSDHLYCADGAYPTFSGVIFDSEGNLYGTAYQGGAYRYGVVFELSPSEGGWTETVLYNFCAEGYPCNITGAYPVNDLVMSRAGNLYGRTFKDGPVPGTVFELRHSRRGWTEKTIYYVDNGGYAGVTLDDNGHIFGVSTSTVFELSRGGGKGVWTPTVIHTFTGSPKDGYYAQGTPVLDEAGNLYGTTYQGGVREGGAVYKLSSVKEGKNKGEWKERVIYSFKGEADGSSPWAGVVLDAAGNIYGTTTSGGKDNGGTIFELLPQVGKGWYRKRRLWSFNGTDGYTPYGRLMLDDAGNLYGTTSSGGSSGGGVVFEVTP